MPYVLFALRSCYIALAAVAFVFMCTYTVLEKISVTVLHHFHTVLCSWCKAVLSELQQTRKREHT
jgi:hypothetical protein